MTHRYDSSQLTTYMICPYKYRLQYIDALRKREQDESTISLSFGIAVHKFLERLYTNTITNIDTDIPTIWEEYSEFPEEQVLTKENGQLLSRAYIDRYKEENKQLTVHSAEEVITMELGKYTFVVKLDTAVTMHGCHYSLEHKTSRKLPQYAMKTFEMAHQLTAQTAAITQLIGSCSGVILDLIVPRFVTKPVLLQPDDPQVSEYSIVETKYSKYYKQEMAYCSGFKCEFERQIFNRFPEQIDGWRYNSQLVITEIERARDFGIFRKSDTGYMCTYCQYKELCQMSQCEELDEGIKDMLYEQVDNPLEYLETE